MDSFEALVRLLLEQDGFWTRQSHKVNLSKAEKRAIGKPSIPRPEIDVIGFNPKENLIVAMEVKSLLDSPGVYASGLKEVHEVSHGLFKLFTSANYREIVFQGLRNDLTKVGLADENTTIRLGLAAGKIHKGDENELHDLFNSNGWLLWGPAELATRMKRLSALGYENDPFILSSKLIHRNPVE